MKFFHLSDLHIGKLLNGFNLRENQEAVLEQITAYAAQLHPDAVLICGDIYDKAVPSGEAYSVFSQFLVKLSKIRPQIPVLVIAGNHDSPERLSYASYFLEKNLIYLSVFPPLTKEEGLKKVVLEDEYGAVNFYLLPFVKPGTVKKILDGRPAESYEAAVKLLLDRENFDYSQRNVILSHQFYAGSKTEPELCESEQSVILSGGLDRIDASILFPFDYAALGHLHGAQRAGADHVRYCGTPYKYSVSEEHHKKAVTLVTLGEKGSEILIEYLPLSGLQDVRRERGTLKELLAGADIKKRCDFVSITVEEEEEPYHVREKLEEAYEHILELRFDNRRLREQIADTEEEIPVLQPLDAFRQFYEALRNIPLSEEQEKWMAMAVQAAKEEDGL